MKMQQHQQLVDQLDPILKKLIYLETSAKNNSNVEKAFEYMSYKLIEYYTTNQNDYRLEKEDTKINGLDIKVSEGIKRKSCTCWGYVRV